MNLPANETIEFSSGTSLPLMFSENCMFFSAKICVDVLSKSTFTLVNSNLTDRVK